MRKILIGSAFALAAWPAWAQTQQQRDWCASPTATDDQTIAGCTALIESGRENTNSLAADYDNRAFSYNNKQLYDQAIADATRAIALAPNNYNSYNNSGNAYDDKGLHDLAIADYTKSIALRPNNADAYANRADVYHEKGEDALGLPDAEKGVSLGPSDAKHLTIRGRIYAAVGQRDKAIADFRAALKLDPNHDTAKQGLVRLGIKP